MSEWNGIHLIAFIRLLFEALPISRLKVTYSSIHAQQLVLLGIILMNDPVLIRAIQVISRFWFMNFRPHHTHQSLCQRVSTASKQLI